MASRGYKRYGLWCLKYSNQSPLPNTVDVVDLQSFVNVSLTTLAGEGDLANDKLSTLSIVGTGYRSLIYELKLDASFETLSKSCTTIWKALEANPNLPTLLVSDAYTLVSI